MKILLIGNYLGDQQQSMLRYAQMLQRNLRELGHAAELVHPPAVLNRLSFIPERWVKCVAYIDKYILAPIYLIWRSRRFDIVHICDHSNAIYRPLFGTKAAIITCHDLIAIDRALGCFPEQKTTFTGKLLQRWIRFNLVRMPYIICGSQKTKSELHRLAPSLKASVTVIYYPLNAPYFPVPKRDASAILEDLKLAPEMQYFFHVGGNHWYKNRLAVAAIFVELRKIAEFSLCKLIMAGKPWTKELHLFCAQAGLEGAVFEIVNPKDHELRALYSGAEAFLFPSRAEGFGWPIIEAQACGCPVITTNREPMTEIAGDAAIFIDPDFPAEAAKIIHQQWWRRPLLRKAGFENLIRFSQQQMMGRYCKAYEAVAASAPLPPM